MNLVDEERFELCKENTISKIGDGSFSWKYIVINDLADKKTPQLRGCWAIRIRTLTDWTKISSATVTP